MANQALSDILKLFKMKVRTRSTQIKLNKDRNNKEDDDKGKKIKKKVEEEEKEWGTKIIIIKLKPGCLPESLLKEGSVISPAL